MKETVLFLCENNSCRSQMAEAFLRHLAGDRFHALSAGLQPSEIHPLTYRAMNELGIDLAGQRSKNALEYLRAGLSPCYAVIVCDLPEENCPKIYPAALSVLRWPFEDPAKAVGTEREQLEIFRRVRDAIRARVTDWLSELY